MFPPLSHFKGEEVGSSKRILWGTTLALQFPSRADKASLDIFLLIKRLKVRLSKLNDDLTRIKKCVNDSSDIELMGASDKEFAPMVRSEVSNNLAHHITAIKNALCVFEQAQKALAVNPLPEEWKKLFVETIRYWEDRVEYTSSILSEMLGPTARHTVVFVGWFGGVTTNRLHARLFTSKDSAKKHKEYTGIIPELQSRGYHFLVCSKDENENIKLVENDENSTTNTVFRPKFWNITELLMFTAAYSDLYRCGYKWLKTNWLSLEKSYKTTKKPMKFLTDQIKKTKRSSRYYRDIDLMHNIGVLENTFHIFQTDDSTVLREQSYEDVFKNNMRRWKTSFEKTEKNSK